MLLIHGLFDCPFSHRDLGEVLQASGVFCRSILLPGHGTKPSDLLHITYHDWVETVRYGVEKLRDEAEQIILVGFSTGAALSIYHALQDSQIAGIVLLAPAIRIKAPVDAMIHWQYLTRWLHTNQKWIVREEESDYAKYHSFPFNPVFQLSNLIDAIEECQGVRKLNCPIFMAISAEDEIVSSQAAIHFFHRLSHPKSRLLQYTSEPADSQHDPRILLRNATYPALHIDNFSHTALPFKPDNFHYGKQGDYPYATHSHQKACVYGAYNRAEIYVCEKLHQLGIVKKKKCELTYNPDFDFMSQQIIDFIETC